MREELRQVRKALEPLEPRFDDYYLIRFLRARKGDVPAAIEMLRAHFKWRQENKIDELYYNHMFNPTPFPEEAQLAWVYPTGYWGMDNDGRVIYFERIGAADYKGVFRICNKERYLEHFAYQYEKLIWLRFPACRPQDPKGDYRDQTLTFIDLHGLSWDHLSSTTRSLFRQISELASNHYPEIMGRTLVINAPKIFNLMWAGLKGFVNVETRGKITVLSAGKKTSDIIDKYVPHETLPDFLGGRIKGVKGPVDYGPWQHDPDLMYPPTERRPHRVRKSPTKDSFVTCIEDEPVHDVGHCWLCTGFPFPFT